MENAYESSISWLSSAAYQIILILAFAWLARKFGTIFLERFIQRIIKHDVSHTQAEKKQREETLLAIFHASFSVILVIVAGMMILDALGVQIAPLIASAGVVGVALGFGGQWLIKDLIAGLFIILENQFRVGDVVNLQVAGGDKIGTVEDITLRTTMLRDLGGQLHHVPNGGIIVASNLSMKFAGINLDLMIPIDQDIDKVSDLINKTSSELTKDKDWKDKIVEAPKFLRINDFTENHMIVKITGKTPPLEQWAVAGELRQRLQKAFKAAKIPMSK